MLNEKRVSANAETPAININKTNFDFIFPFTSWQASIHLVCQMAINSFFNEMSRIAPDSEWLSITAVVVLGQGNANEEREYSTLRPSCRGY